MWTLLAYTDKKIPIYQKIMLLIESLIRGGGLSAGSLIPSERKLALLLNVNRSTVIRAFDELTARGLLVRRKGSGTFVNSDKWGLQTTPIINWHNERMQNESFPFSISQISAYQKHISNLSDFKKSQLIDLSNGDLPLDLLPKLSIPDFSWHTLIDQEIDSHSDEKNNALGILSLRKAVQIYLKDTYQMRVALEDILITSGTQQALFLITQGLLKPGDAIGVEAPSYFYSLRLFQATGLKIIPISTDEDGMTLTGLEEISVKYPLKMILLNPIFQNPTGSVMPLSRKKAILSYCHLKRIPLVEDDAYGGLSFDHLLDTTPIKKIDVQQQVLYLGSLSKYVGQHIRIGWMIGPNAILKQLADIRTQIDSGLSILPQLLAENFLRHEMVLHQQFLVSKLSVRAEALAAWLRDQFGQNIMFKAAKGGFHLYAQFSYSSKEAMHGVLMQLLKHNIIVAEGSIFGDTKYGIRLTYCHFKKIKACQINSD